MAAAYDLNMCIDRLFRGGNLGVSDPPFKTVVALFTTAFR